jgi:signal transduction histidine kinase
MNTSTTTHRISSSGLHRFIRSSFFPSSFSALEKTRNNPAGYAGTVTHEIRNPLCNITLALEMLSLTNLDAEQIQYLDIISRGSVRIKELVNALLITDHITGDASGLYSLNQLLEEVLVMARDRISLKKITVIREYGATEQRVFLNSEKMKVALTNIVINAIDAMPQEGGVLKLVSRSTDKQSFIEIQDNGIGISKADLARIFQPFFTNKPGGMGLGLSATLDILRADHTGVDVSSEPGVGTCFTLSFDKR